MEKTFLFCRWWIGESTDGVIYTESSLSMRIPGQSSWNYVSITDLEKRGALSCAGGERGTVYTIDSAVSLLAGSDWTVRVSLLMLVMPVHSTNSQNCFVGIGISGCNEPLYRRSILRLTLTVNPPLSATTINVHLCVCPGPGFTHQPKFSWFPSQVYG